MKSKQLLAVLFSLLIIPVMAQEPEIFWRFNNTKILYEDASYLQFDVQIKCDQDKTWLRDLQIYFDYNPAAFGHNVVNEGKITSERIGIMHIPQMLNPLAPLNGIVNQADNTSCRYAILFDSQYPARYGGEILFFQGMEFPYNVEVPTDWIDFMRFQLEITDENELAGIAFHENIMNGGQYYTADGQHGPVGYKDEGNYINDLLDQPLKLNNTLTSTFVVSSDDACENEELEITYTGNASPLAEYHWDFDGGIITSGSGAGPYTVLWDDGAFKAITLFVKENGQTSDTTANSIEVYDLPEILEQPAGVTACHSNMASFTINVESGIPTVLKWYGPDGLIPDSNTSTLTINNVTEADEGQYWCVVANNCQNVCSDTVALTVNTSPVITFQSGDADACEGGEITMEVSVAGSEPLMYEWYGPNGLIPGANQDILTLENITLNMAGGYFCHVSNICGVSDSEVITLFVDPLPFAAGPINGPGSVNAGDIGVVYSIPEVNYATWYDWALPEGAIITKGSGSNSITVEFTNNAQSGYLSVFAENDCGAGATAEMYVEVNTNHFEPAWSGTAFMPMTFTVFGAEIDDINMQEGDEIGIFDGNICVGVGKLVNEIPPYIQIVTSADDPQTMQTDGFIAGNVVTYQLWDQSNNQVIHNVEATYVSGVGIFEHLGSAGVTLSGSNTNFQLIDLSDGWNMISFNALPANMDMLNIVDPLIVNENLIKVSDENGNTIENFPGYGWMNFIGEMSPTEGYYVRVEGAANLHITGPQVVLPMNIGLSAGWNIMGFPSASAQSTAEVFQELMNTGILEKVINEAGNTIEYIDGFGWIDNINYLLPGEGYYINVNEYVNLTIQEPQQAVKPENNSPQDNRVVHFNPVFNGNPYNPMSIMVVCPTSFNCFEPGDEIGIFDGDVCVGAGTVIDHPQGLQTIVASADDPITPATDGFIDGNNILLKYWDVSEDRYIEMELSFNTSFAEVFEQLGTAHITLDPIFTGLYDDPVMVTSIYPNPFSSELNVKYEVKEADEVQIGVYDLTGQLISLMVDSEHQPGIYEAQWISTQHNGENVKPGVYFIKLKAGKNSMTKKIIKLE